MTLREQIQAAKTLSDGELLYLRAAIMFELRRRSPEPTEEPNERIAAYWRDLYKESPHAEIFTHRNLVNGADVIRPVDTTGLAAAPVRTRAG